jgi:predicted DNA-binding transcriptional regulator YafY
MAHKKLKLLYLAQLFQEQTDEEHTVTVKDMIAYLDKLGIPAERKAIYEDLELLRLVGMDIVHTRTKTHNFHLGQRTFELPELKMLIDVVQASPFLTAKKSMKLIGKLESLASTAQAGSLRRQVCVLNRVKTRNEQLYYNIDGINQAINEDKCIRFRYFDWTIQGGRAYRHGGKVYQECPAALCVDRNYYLITYRPEEQRFIHFRVDRISNLKVADLARPALPKGFDPARYVRTIFDMHSGDTQQVTLELDKHLLNVAMDRFGRDANYREGPNGEIILSAEVEVSPTFLSWVLCFGGQARILEPASAQQALCRLASEALARY